MIKKGKNRAIFKIKGLNQEKAINSLSKDIKIYNFKRIKHNESEFEVDFFKEKYVKNALKTANIEILSVHHNGFFSFLKRIFTSYGLIIALFLSIIFYFFQYQFVLKIEVFGEDKVQEREIKDFVFSALPSRAKTKIDTKKLEGLVKDNFKDISSLSIAIIGQTLVLNIYEGTNPDEMEGNYQPLLSAYDGLVREINLIQGTMAVNEGDLVQKGDVLVYPYVIDSQGQQRPIKPKAEIFADVWFCEKEMHYDFKLICVRTGEKVKKSEVYLNNLRISSNNFSHNYQDFEVEEKVVKLSYNLIFPFTLKTTTYYQTKIVEIKEDFDDVKEKIIASAREKTLIFLQENEIIKEESYTIREEGGCHEVSFMITISRNIGG